MPPTRQDNDTWRNRTHPIEEDMQFQRGTWRAERIGWVVLWLIVLLALLGLFSEGPLSMASVESPAGDLRITYGRFERNGAPAELKLAVEPRRAGEVAIRISAPVMEAFTIESVTPKPRTERGIAGGVELLFPVAAGGPLTVHMTMRARSVGVVTGEIGIGENRPARLSQFIYP
ncbi:hypothetical protein [Dongia deserti]|uniref:hypothetical protein n=1 Tax=Dongia deserti TaxID=2268030 RepID=UPI000E64730B|nr:hypothetical protein [Dongia deserti]